MLQGHETVQDFLKDKKIRLSHQRLMVLDFMLKNRCHPTAEQIFSGLKQTVPTLSRTTIYNTMDAFADAGIVRPLSIEGNEIRYDINTENHGHFKCVNCGEVFDFELDLDQQIPELRDFKILTKDIHYRGLCKRCLEENQTKH
jgi:Fe2+ or Zn2+ uptake regulation protein